MKNRRVLLKLSGEALAGEKGTGFDEAICRDVARQVRTGAQAGTEVCIVIGGGNFWRGRTSERIDRVRADQIGMLATVMNAIYVSQIFESEGMETEVYTPFTVGAMTKLFSKAEADRDLKAGKIVFFAGGTGHPYFSTDTGAALRAIEMEADQILLAKAIDGVYDADPATHPEAKKYDTVSLSEVLEKQLKVIDLTATALCMENHMPLAVFGLSGENSIENALRGQITGTVVTAS
ncbi:MAG: UMP kinase [Lachnospiraceae bacterium]|nr:UMP kinase [Lachnospiraceae bacterium]